jgi:GTPase
VRSIHVLYTSVDAATAGQSAGFAIRAKGGKPKVAGSGSGWAKKGMTLVDAGVAPAAFWEFTAEVLVLHHATTLCAGYTPTVHVGVVSQAAQVLSIAGLDGAPLASLRTADRAVLHCRFAHKPELIREGDTLLFREGRAKGVGRIRSVESPHRLPGSARRPD